MQSAYIHLYLIMINVITFALYGLDKWRAMTRQWRVREKKLIILALIGYIIYLFASYHRIEDNLPLEVESHAADAELTTEKEYSALTYNSGFGAYTPDFSFFGALIGMTVFHHKTRKWYFRLGIPLILGIQVSLILCFYDMM